MLRAAENERLTLVGPGTPMGNLLRRYWLPACKADEVQPGGAPALVELLGERFVAFRSPSGDTGLLDERCPHRAASLLLARNEDCGLRCIYHGWQIDRDGRLVDVPTSSNPERMASVVRHGSYPLVERGGLLWAYLGPEDEQPPFPDFEWLHLPLDQIEIFKAVAEANWAQAVESFVDSAHVSYLHRDSIVPDTNTEISSLTDAGQARNTADACPQFEVQDRPYGFRYAAIRVPLKGADVARYVRTTVFVAPIYALIAAPQGTGHFDSYVPMNDYRSVHYTIQFRTDRAMTDDDREGLRKWFGVRPGIDIDERFRKIRNAGNRWLQDHQRMREDNLFSGIDGITNEDHAAIESLGPIVDRTREHLGATDAAVIRFRRIMLAAARRVERGEPALGVRKGIPYADLRAREGMVRLDQRWQDVLDDGMAVPEPDAAPGAARA